MLTALVLFVSVYLAVRALMAKLLQNLQDASTSFTGQGHDQGSYRYGSKVHWQSSAYNVDKYGVESVYVPKIPFSKQMENFEVRAYFKECMPMELQQYPDHLHVDHLHRCSIESCYKCVPMSKETFVANCKELENALVVRPVRRGWLTPVDLMKNSIYLTCKKIPHTYMPIPKEILTSKRVKDAISRAVEDDPETDQAVHSKRAACIFERMRASISTSLLRVAVWFMHRIMSRMLTGLYVPRGQIDMIKSASELNVPIVYLPLHRSHLDYILVTYVLYLNDMRLPLVAAGDNLLIPLFGQLLRGLGGFFIKRRLDFKDGRKDHVYRAVLKEYMKGILMANHSLEFFLEGGRSRTGKTRLPKAGLLSVIVDSFYEEPWKDILIVPISISYEKLLDGNFVSEQLGEPKVMETFTAALTSIWKILHSNYGAVRVDFCQPISLMEFLNCARISSSAPLYFDCPLSLLEAAKDSRTVKYNECTSTTSLSSPDGTSEETRAAIKSLANHVVHQSTASLSLMSTSLVAFLLLTKHRKGGTLQQLADSLCWLRSEVRMHKRQVMCLGDDAETVRRACALLGKELVISETVQMEWSSGDTENNNVKIVFYRPALHLPSVLELQYYANAVLPVFVPEAIVATSLYVLTGEVTLLHELPLVISKRDLLSKCQDLINILQREFVLVLPCSSVQEVIDDAISYFAMNDILCTCDSTQPKQDDPYAWSTDDESSLNDSDYEYGESREYEFMEEYSLVLDDISLMHLEFLRSVLASYIESYWVVACSLFKLVGTPMEERIFFQEIQKVAQDKLQEGTLCYEESFAADTLHNAVQLYEQWGIVEHHTQDCICVLYLNEQWNVDEAINSVISFVGQFRQ